MCNQCDDISRKISITRPDEYFSVLKQVKNFVAENLLTIIEGTCDIDKIQKNTPWPSDHIEHVLRCTSCGRRFILSVETYHGSGGCWDLLPE